MLVVLAAACTPPPDGPAAVSGPTLTASPDVSLARRLELTLDRPVALEIAIETPTETHTVRLREVAQAFDLPVLGLAPDAISTVTLTVTDPVTRTATTLDPLTVWTEPLPATFPVIEALAHDPERAEPGWWLLSLDPPAGGGWLVLLDVADLSVDWMYTGPIDFGDVRMTERGTLLGLFGGAHEIDLLGNTVRRWLHPDLSEIAGGPVPGVDVPVPWTVLHHEVYPLDDGSMVSLTQGQAWVDAYPRGYERPTPILGANLADDHLVWFEDDGSVIAELPMSRRLDTNRIGFGSLDWIGLGYDWVHANAVVADPAGGFLVSSRHQGAVVKFSDRGDTEWILSDPAGWSEEFHDQLLTPTAGTRWPYHQHGPNVGPDGRIVLFDNRNVTHTPYTEAPPEPPVSRVVAYDVDPAAMTVHEAWSWEPPGGALLSEALGNAVWLPETGHVLAAWGFLDGEGDVPNALEGRGWRHARVIEIDPRGSDPDPEPVIDLRLWTDRDVEPAGIKVYRVAHVPSVYGSTAE